ncbi:MAG TPA: ribosome silencing factor [Vicinamibacterales bacterium]
MAATRTTTARKTVGVKKRAVSRKVKLPKAVIGAVRAAQSKKAVDVVVLDLRRNGGFTDYFVICTGGSGRQIQAIADAVKEVLKRDFGERPLLAEGIEKSEWILLDYFDFVVHVFSAECRAFYGLERLWGNAERHELVEPA